MTNLKLAPSVEITLLKRRIAHKGTGGLGSRLRSSGEDEGQEMNGYWDEMDDDYDDQSDPPCITCGGAGKVVTMDYESYLGANYKPCPTCGGDPCISEPPCS